MEGLSILMILINIGIFVFMISLAVRFVRATEKIAENFASN